MLAPQIARQQHGVFSRAQARQEGFDHRTVRRRVRDGVWVEQLTDVFTLAGTDRTPIVLSQAAALATGGVVSHFTAAALHKIDGVPADLVPPGVHVTMPPRTHAVVDGVVEHRLRLPSIDRMSIEGVPVTTRTRTLVDLMAGLSRYHATGLLFRATQNGWIDRQVLDHAVAGRKGMHGTPQLRELAAYVGSGAHSAAEHALHAILRRIDGSAWHANSPLAIDGRRVVVDALEPARKLVVEVDGRGFHTDSERFQHDRERQNRLVAAGYTVLRFTWLDVANRPDYVRRTVIRQLT